MLKPSDTFARERGERGNREEASVFIFSVSLSWLVFLFVPAGEVEGLILGIHLWYKCLSRDNKLRMHFHKFFHHTHRPDHKFFHTYNRIHFELRLNPL